MFSFSRFWSSFFLVAVLRLFAECKNPPGISGIFLLLASRSYEDKEVWFGKLAAVSSKLQIKLIVLHETPRFACQKKSCTVSICNPWKMLCLMKEKTGQYISTGSDKQLVKTEFVNQMSWISTAMILQLPPPQITLRPLHSKGTDLERFQKNIRCI